MAINTAGDVRSHLRWQRGHKTARNQRTQSAIQPYVEQLLATLNTIGWKHSNVEVWYVLYSRRVGWSWFGLAEKRMVFMPYTPAMSRIVTDSHGQVYYYDRFGRSNGIWRKLYLVTYRYRDEDLVTMLKASIQHIARQ